MAKVTIVGDALVITSSMKWDDLKTIEKYRPKALILTEGEGDKQTQIFKVATGTTGEIGKLGAVFSGKTHDDDELATITKEFKFVSERDVKEVAAEYLGVAILYLNKVEEQLPTVLAEIAAEKADIMSNITVA